jgi:hypothetical protein
MKSWRWWPACLIVGPVLAVLIGLSSPQAPGQGAYHGGAQQRAGQSPTQIVGPKTADERLADYTAALAWFTAALAAVGAIQFGASLVQIRYLVRADRGGRDALDNARKASAHELRAYIVPRKPNVFLLGVTGNIGCQIALKNVGATPAYETVCSLTLYVDDYPSARNVAAGQVGGPTVFEIWPKHTVIVTIDPSAEIRLADGQHNAIQRGAMAVYVQGVVEYTDAFGEQQRTEFSYYKLGVDWISSDRQMSLRASGNKSRRNA